MTNDERSTKQERKNKTAIVRHLIIRHSFELRHSDFVIPLLVSESTCHALSVAHASNLLLAFPRSLPRSVMVALETLNLSV